METKSAINSKKRDLVQKINIAANYQLSIKIVNAHSQLTESSDYANYGLKKLLKQRAEVAQAFLTTNDEQKKEELFEIFSLLSDNIKAIIGL